MNIVRITKAKRREPAIFLRDPTIFHTHPRRYREEDPGMPSIGWVMEEDDEPAIYP